MKYIKQFSIIILVSLIAEILAFVIPIPVPASIYGLVIMLVCLLTKLIKVEDVRETSNFLIEIMPVMFIPAAVGLMSCWEMIRPVIIPYAVITVVSTVVVMAVSGLSAQGIITLEERRRLK